MRKAVARCSVAVVGGGVAGLSLATELSRLGVDDIEVIEREPCAGGVPRHCGHYPFGWTEFRRVFKGPAYAARMVAEARSAGVRIRCGTTVTQLHPDGRLSLSDNSGKYALEARRVVLCTGTREGTRAQRFLSGQRPQGVLPTGAVQSMAYLRNMRPFKRPVILGTELVSMSAIMTCKHMGIKPIAMLEENARPTVPRFMQAYPMLNRIALHTNVRELQIHGQQHVEAIEFRDASGKQTTLETDGVIVSGQFRPESALIRASHLAIDSSTGGPVVDQYYRTTDPAYYSAGNVLRPVENATWCWTEGRSTASILAEDLISGIQIQSGVCLSLELDHPALKWVVPQRIIHSTSDTGMKNLQLRVNEYVDKQLLIKAQGEILWSGRLNSLPERRRLIPMQPLLAHVDRCAQSGPVQLCLNTQY